MKTFNLIWQKIDGYKTYATAITMILYAVVIIGWQGQDWVLAVKLVLEAVAMASIRHAI